MKISMVLIVLLSLTIPCFAQFGNETITITTYYPSPYGVYRNMRLYPSEEPTVGVEEGVMYYNQTSKQILVRNDTQFVPIGGQQTAGSPINMACMWRLVPGLSSGNKICQENSEICFETSIDEQSCPEIAGINYSALCCKIATPSPGTPLLNPQVYSTPGTYQFTVPANVTKIMVEMWGAGGGGTMGAAVCGWAFCPGGGGSYNKGVFSVNENEEYTVIVGSGGQGQKGSCISAEDGGESSVNGPGISSSFIAGGGSGGTTSAVLPLCQTPGGNFQGGIFGINGTRGLISDYMDYYTSVGGNAPQGGEGGRDLAVGAGWDYRIPPEKPGGGGCGRFSECCDGADGTVIIYY